MAIQCLGKEAVKPRTFMKSAGAVSVPLVRGESGSAPKSADPVLAGMSLTGLRKHYHSELFESYLPFWNKFGIDHEYGGFMCSLDYDGTLVNTDKSLWFQGRGIWVYSFLYNHFGKETKYLGIASKTKDFVLKHAPQPDGWWAEELARDGSVRKPFAGDIYGMYFVAEGLQEYAWATQDNEVRDRAFALMKKLYRYMDRPDFRLMGDGAPGVRAQGLWMVNLRIATQILRRWKDTEISAIAERAVEVLITRHYNADIGLNNEMLNFDFSRLKSEETKSLLGHSIETLWMAQDEADRRNDAKLWDICAERIHRHIEVGWDHIFGGLAQSINVNQGGYVWPSEHPVGTDLEFRFTGEYQYMKALWALHEILIATLNVFERTGAEWAARFFTMAQDVIDTKFSMKKLGLPGSMLFGDRRMTVHPHVARQDNYHPLRQLMLTILTLDRMIQRCVPASPRHKQSAT
jgi:N-acylglucosamine 2-epimerase